MDSSKTPRAGSAIASPPALLAGLVIIGGAAATLSLNLPGHLSYDSILQLAQGRSGHYNNWHPPVMAWLLGLADAVTPGAALFVVFDCLLIFGALLSFAFFAGRSSWLAPLLAALLAASPQLIVYPAIVWKDVLFAGSAVAGFAGLTLAAGRWARPAIRYGLLSTALLLLVLAALARQNGAVVLPFGAVAAGWIAARSEGPTNWRRGWMHGLAFLGAAALVAAAATAALNTRNDGEPVTRYQWESLETYDIAGALAVRPDTELGVLRARAPRLEAFLRTQGVAAYSPARINPLVALQDRLKMRDEYSSAVAAQWRRLALGHPLLYGRVRATAFRWVFIAPDPEACVPVYVGVDGPRDAMHALGLAQRMSNRDEAMESYARKFTATPVLSHGAYAILALFLLTGLALRQRPEDIAVAAMLGSAIAFTLTFVVISIACDYRYLYFLDVAAMAGAVYAAATFQRERESPAC